MSYILSSALENFVDTLRDEAEGQRYAKREDPSLRQSLIPVVTNRTKTSAPKNEVPTPKSIIEPLKIPGEQKEKVEKPILPPGGGSTTGLGLGSGSGSGLGSSGTVFGSGTGAMSTDASNIGAIKTPTTDPGTGSGISSVGDGSGLEEESRRIAGSGLSYWDEHREGVPTINDVTGSQQTKQTVTQTSAEQSSSQDSIPLGRLLVTFVLLLMSLVMLTLAGWGASTMLGMTTTDNGATEQSAKMMGMLMLAGGGLMGLCMLAGAGYVLFLHEKLGKSKSRRRR